MLQRHFIEGSPQFMLFIFIFWIIALALAITTTWFNIKGKFSFEKATKWNRLLLFIGSFTFMFGILVQVLGFMQAFQVIQEVGDVSPKLIAGGIYVSMLAPAYGFILFIITYIVWFINKNYLIKN